MKTMGDPLPSAMAVPAVIASDKAVDAKTPV